MQTNVRVAVSLLITLSASGQTGEQWSLPNFSDRVQMTVFNPAAERFHGVVVIDSANLGASAPDFPSRLNVAVTTGKPARFLPTQVDDFSRIGGTKEVSVALALLPHQSKRIEIYYSKTLSDEIPWPKRVHASHAYGYNRSTATIESEKIGYRTYGGFFFDVQAHQARESGLINSVLGYARTSTPTAEGRDIVHYGNTLGLGGLYVRVNENLYRPPLNKPDYLHQPHTDEEPTYRVLTSGPLRAIVEATAPHWKLGEDEVALRARYEMRAGEEVVYVHLWIQPLHITRVYEVGVGVLNLPSLRVVKTHRSISVCGMQDPAIGTIALGLAFDPDSASIGEVVRTPDGDNQAVRFHRRLTESGTFEATYQFAAAWQGSGRSDPLRHLNEVLSSMPHPVASLIRHSLNPYPSELQGEPH